MNTLTPIDTLIVARRVETLSDGPPATAPPNAVAIAGGRVAALGAADELRAAARSATRVLELPDAILTPGLVDCHTHFFYWALHRARSIELVGQPSLESTLAALHAGARTRGYGNWLVGFGCDWNTWPTGRPTAHDLDAAFPDRPVLIRSRDAHSVWLNTAALRAAGLGADTPDPPRGRYVRDNAGKLTGIVQEAAIDLLPDPAREFALREDDETLRAIDAALAEAFAEAHRHGLVGVHSMDDTPSLTHLQRLHRANMLKLRVAHAIPLANLQAAIQIGLRSGFGDDWLRFGAVKIFSDGALGSQTAYMFAPYPDTDDVGVPVVAGAELRETVVRAAKAGIASWIHAIGDRAVSECIDAIAAAREIEPAPLPHRIEHAQCIRSADVRRMAQHDIIASVQPCHILGDIPTARRYWPDAQHNAYPLRSLLDAGVTLACGSDVPIESLDPRRSLLGAICRTDETLEPAGGWVAEQKITVREALVGFTRGAARVAGADPRIGTLTPGAPADLTIWGADPLASAPEALLEIPILGAIVGGEVFASGVG